MWKLMLMIWKNIKASGFLKRKPSCFSVLQAAAVGGEQVSSVWAVAWEAFASHTAPERALCFLIPPPVQEGLTWEYLGVSIPPFFFFSFFLVVTKEVSEVFLDLDFVIFQCPYVNFLLVAKCQVIWPRVPLP